ncbi:predicted protein [Coccidioides posadasii str. Silveira]|uniref:Predicted protein n=1 Tax=Coccidioides posadasii (strain RMSCC 757 / Silveira) TaxID=443226 RepID=E9CW31_COCPS|nr:predicted protein [Coccidioides posadasii str. Silveira]
MQMQTRLFEKFLSLAEYASYFLNKALGAIAAEPYRCGLVAEGFFERYLSILEIRLITSAVGMQNSPPSSYILLPTAPSVLQNNGIMPPTRSPAPKIVPADSAVISPQGKPSAPHHVVLLTSRANFKPRGKGVSTKSKQKPRNRITIISSSAPSELSTSERAIPVHSAWVSPTNSDLPGRKYCPVVSVDFHASPTREPRVCQVPASRRYKKKAGRFTHKRWNHAEKEKDFLTPAKLRDRS